MSNQENGNAPAANALPAAAPAANGRGRNFTFDEDRFVNDSYEENLPVSADEREMAFRTSHMTDHPGYREHAVLQTRQVRQEHEQDIYTVFYASV